MNSNDTQDSHNPLQLHITVTGPGVGEGRMSVADLLRIIEPTQTTVKKIANVIAGRDSSSRGRSPKEIEDLCRFQFVGWHRGSAVIVLELPPPPTQTSLVPDIGQQSVEVLINGLGTLTSSSAESVAMPEGIDFGVLASIEQIGRAIGPSVSRIAFHTRNGIVSQEVAYDIVAHNRIRGILEKPIRPQAITRVGRLEQISGHNSYSGRLYSADGTSVACRFKPEHVEMLPDLWMHVVNVTGTLDETLFVVDTLVAAEELDSSQGSVTSFWKDWTIDELVECQDVSPVTSIDDLASFWPEDVDPDSLLEFVACDRNQRRSIFKSRGEN